MNLLDFITVYDLNEIEEIKRMPISFQMINLQTRDFPKAKKQCDEFFCINKVINLRQLFYYTESSEYQRYGGFKYELKKSNDGVYWLLLKNDEKIEV